MAVSLDLFGTLVTADRPAAPWDAVAAALQAREIPVPADWEAAYRTSHRDCDPGREAPLDEHVRLALASRGVDIAAATASEATLAAFDSPVTVRDGAETLLAAASAIGPVGICSNCSVPGLVDRTLTRAGLEPGADASIDAVVTSVDCGWRKPHAAIFEATASVLGGDVADLVHIGDDARTDGGAERAGGRSIILEGRSLHEIAASLEAGQR